MTAPSRRLFLKRASTGAAAVGVLTALPALTPAADAAPAHDGSFVAWVNDARTGEIVVLVGTHEQSFTDKKLARRLAQMAAQAHRA